MQLQTFMVDDWLTVPALVSSKYSRKHFLSNGVGFTDSILRKALNVGMSVAIWIGK